MFKITVYSSFECFFFAKDFTFSMRVDLITGIFRPSKLVCVNICKWAALSLYVAWHRAAIHVLSDIIRVSKQLVITGNIKYRRFVSLCCMSYTLGKCFWHVNTPYSVINRKIRTQAERTAETSLSPVQIYLGICPKLSSRKHTHSNRRATAQSYQPVPAQHFSEQSSP